MDFINGPPKKGGNNTIIISKLNAWDGACHFNLVNLQQIWFTSAQLHSYYILFSDHASNWHTLVLNKTMQA